MAARNESRNGESLKVLTANRLGDGAVVFLTNDNGWSRSLHRARLAEAGDALALLDAAGRKAVAACQVVGPYLIDVEARDGEVVPTRLRERIRAFGPTVRPGPAGRAA